MWQSARYKSAITLLTWMKAGRLMGQEEALSVGRGDG